MGRIFTSLVLSVTVASQTSADTVSLLALTDRGKLLVVDAEHPQSARSIPAPACTGTLIGIDRRPADGGLYGLTDTNDIVRLDVATGTCTVVSTLTIPFSGGHRSGIDFNPQSDRLRCMGADRQNLRIHPTLGATALDTALAFAAGDAHVGTRTEIVGSAYSANRVGSPSTKLYEIDAAADVLVIQDPPNDGNLSTVGPIGVDVGPEAGFDIRTSESGVDDARLAARGRLYRIDLGTGRATEVGPIGTGETPIVSIAWVDTPP